MGVLFLFLMLFHAIRLEFKLDQRPLHRLITSEINNVHRYMINPFWELFSFQPGLKITTDVLKQPNLKSAIDVPQIPGTPIRNGLPTKRYVQRTYLSSD